MGSLAWRERASSFNGRESNMPHRSMVVKKSIATTKSDDEPFGAVGVRLLDNYRLQLVMTSEQELEGLALVADFQDDMIRPTLPSRLRDKVESSFAYFGKAKEQEARDNLSTMHLAYASYMKPFYLWKSRATIGDKMGALDARQIVQDSFDSAEESVYWTATGVRAIRRGQTDFELKFDENFADFGADKDIFDNLTSEMKAAVQAIAHAPPDIGTQKVSDFYVEMYHKQIVACMVQRWSSRSVQHKDVIDVLKWIEKYCRLTKRLTAGGSLQLDPTAAGMRKIIKPHADSFIATSKDRLHTILLGVLQQASEIEEDGVLHSTFCTDAMKAIADVVQTAFRTGCEPFIGEVIDMVMTTMSDILMDIVDNEVMSKKNSSDVSDDETDVFSRIVAATRDAIAQPSDSQEISTAGECPTDIRYLCAMVNNMQFCVRQWSSIMEDVCENLHTTEILHMMQAKSEQVAALHRQIAKKALDAIPTEMIFAHVLQNIGQEFEKIDAKINVYRLQCQLGFPDASVHGLLRHDDVQRCFSRLAKDLVATYLRSILSMSAAEFSDWRLLSGTDRNLFRDALVKSQLTLHTTRLENILGCFSSREQHHRALQAIDTVRELFQCSRDDCQLFVQTAAMQSPDVLDAQIVHMVVNLRLDWIAEQRSRTAIECSSWMNGLPSEATVTRSEAGTVTPGTEKNKELLPQKRGKSSSLARVLLQLLATKATESDSAEQMDERRPNSELISISHAKAAKLKADANDAFRNHEYEEAVRLYTLAISVRQGGDKSLYQNRSIAYMRLGDAESALRDATKCVQLNPNDPKSHYRKARALAQLGRNKAAVRSLEVAREFSPRDPRINQLIAELKDGEDTEPGIEMRCISLATVTQEFDLNADGKVPVVLHTYRPADIAVAVQIRRCRRTGRRRALTPDGWVSLIATDGTRLMVVMDVDCLRRYGNEAFNAGRHQEAVECYSEALLSAGPHASQNHVLYANRSAAYYQLENYPAALEDASESVKLKPLYARGLYRKAKAFAAMPDASRTDVLHSAERALLCMPDSKKIAQLLKTTNEAIVKEATTKSGQMKFWCVNSAGVTADLNPDGPLYFIRMLQPNDIVVVDDIKSTHDGKTRALTQYGWVSLVASSGLVLLKPIDSTHLAMEAERKYRVDGDVEASIGLWSEAIERQPSCRDLVNLATAKFKIGQYSSAMECVERAISLEPSYAKAFYRKGRILTAQGKPLEAQMNLEKALELQPNDPLITFCLAKVRKNHVFYKVSVVDGSYVEASEDLNPKNPPQEDTNYSFFEYLMTQAKEVVQYCGGQLVEVLDVRASLWKPRWRARTPDGWVALINEAGNPVLEMVDPPVVGVRHTLEEQLQQMADELRDAKAAQQVALMRQREESERATAAEAERRRLQRIQQKSSIQAPWLSTIEQEIKREFDQISHLSVKRQRQHVKRELMLRYHPDKMPQLLRPFANEIMVIINRETDKRFQE